MTEYRDEKRGLFWSDLAAASAAKAIDFAMDKIEDPWERQDFLLSWREGDVHDWPAFFEFVGKDSGAPKNPERWYLGSMNDAVFIINTPPRPSNDFPIHDRENGPTLVLRTHPLTKAEREAIVDAHNATVA